MITIQLHKHESRLLQIALNDCLQEIIWEPQEKDVLRTILSTIQDAEIKLGEEIKDVLSGEGQSAS